MSSWPRIFHTVPWTRWARHDVRPPVRAHARDAPAATSSTVRADSHALWPYRTPKTPTRPWRSGVIIRSFPRRGVDHQGPQQDHRPAAARKAKVVPSIGKQHLRAYHPARRLGARARNGYQASKSPHRTSPTIAHRHLAILPLSHCQWKARNPLTNRLFGHGFTAASTESVVSQPLVSCSLGLTPARAPTSLCHRVR
jgi:hypothetical protein